MRRGERKRGKAAHWGEHCARDGCTRRLRVRGEAVRRLQGRSPQVSAVIETKIMDPRERGRVRVKMRVAVAVRT